MITIQNNLPLHKLWHLLSNLVDQLRYNDVVDDLKDDDDVFPLLKLIISKNIPIEFQI